MHRLQHLGLPIHATQSMTDLHLAGGLGEFAFQRSLLSLRVCTCVCGGVALGGVSLYGVSVWVCSCVYGVSV